MLQAGAPFAPSLLSRADRTFATNTNRRCMSTTNREASGRRQNNKDVRLIEGTMQEGPLTTAGYDVE